jgi:aminopeptidase
MPPSDFSKKLEKYAELTIKVGLNLQPGQRLLISNPSTLGVQLHVAPLVRAIAASAYQAGARYVDVIWGDEALTLTRFQLAPRDSFEEYPTWQADAITNFIQNGDALISIRSNNPDLLNEQDSTLVSTSQQVHLEHMKPYSEAVSHNAINWCVIAASGSDWAAKLFPDLSREKAQDKLWEAIFEITRVDQPDPIAAWLDHIHDLSGRSQYLTAKQYTRLHYRAPGTDLIIGLPRGHRWLSAQMTAENGVDFTANLPTEEVFSLPHKDQIDGVVSASLPLSYGGSLLEDFSLAFEKGRVTKVTARKGEDYLRKLTKTDQGAASLGEVAFVPHSSPIAQRGHLFYDALIDENAASHLALGHAYQFTLAGGEAMSKEEFASHGGNSSVLHMDFMIGSKEMDVDGFKTDGTAEPIMRKGEWAFDV